MSKDIRLRKGADLNLVGKAEKKINVKSKSDLFAIQPDDFFSLTPKHCKSEVKSEVKSYHILKCKYVYLT